MGGCFTRDMKPKAIYAVSTPGRNAIVISEIKTLLVWLMYSQQDKTRHNTDLTTK
jgi:hypothetical protein